MFSTGTSGLKYAAGASEYLFLKTTDEEVLERIATSRLVHGRKEVQNVVEKF